MMSRKNMTRNSEARNVFDRETALHGIIDRVDTIVGDKSAQLVFNSTNDAQTAGQIALGVTKQWSNIGMKVLLVNLTASQELFSDIQTTTNISSDQPDFQIMKTNLSDKAFILENKDSSIDITDFALIEKFRTALSELNNEYDRIVICTASNSQSQQNVLAVSAISSGLILIVRSGHTKRRELRDLVKESAKTSVTILGNIWVD